MKKKERQQRHGIAVHGFFSKKDGKLLSFRWLTSMNFHGVCFITAFYSTEMKQQQQQQKRLLKYVNQIKWLMNESSWLNQYTERMRHEYILDSNVKMFLVWVSNEGEKILSLCVFFFIKNGFKRNSRQV